MFIHVVHIILVGPQGKMQEHPKKRSGREKKTKEEVKKNLYVYLGVV